MSANKVASLTLFLKVPHAVPTIEVSSQDFIVATAVVSAIAASIFLGLKVNVCHLICFQHAMPCMPSLKEKARQ